MDCIMVAPSMGEAAPRTISGRRDLLLNGRYRASECLAVDVKRPGRAPCDDIRSACRDVELRPAIQDRVIKLSKRAADPLGGTRNQTTRLQFDFQEETRHRRLVPVPGRASSSREFWELTTHGMPEAAQRSGITAHMHSRPHYHERNATATSMAGALCYW